MDIASVIPAVQPVTNNNNALQTAIKQSSRYSPSSKRRRNDQHDLSKASPTALTRRRPAGRFFFHVTAMA
jgi:hypothetical protein